MKQLIFVFAVLLLLACNKEKESTTAKNILNWIVLKNQAGENLLDPSVQGHYSISDIYVYKYDANGEKIILQNNKVLSGPEVGYYLRMSEYGEDNKNVNQWTVYLNLSPTEVDTLIAEINEVPYTHNTKLWYNGVLIWTLENDTIVEIVK